MKTPHTIREIEISLLKHPLIPRDRGSKHVKLLAASMKLVGQLNPIVVTPCPVDEGYWIGVDGWSRALAARELDWPSLNAIVISGDEAAKLSIHGVVSNTARLDLTLFDAISQASLLLQATAETQANVAAMMGVEASTVSKWLKMSRLEPVILEAMKQPGVITLDDGYALACEPLPQRRMQLFQDLMSGKIARGKIKSFVTKPRKEPSEKIAFDNVTITLPTGADVVKHVKCIHRTIGELLHAFKESGLGSTAFRGWLEQRKGAEHAR